MTLAEQNLNEEGFKKSEYYFLDADFIPNNNVPVNISSTLTYFNLTIFLILS